MLLLAQTTVLQMFLASGLGVFAAIFIISRGKMVECLLACITLAFALYMLT
ncbi:MAG: hypothetical protein IT447_12265 [Phycisphaerales bacterium]|jgi:hypothetical protein|nr:hypothetical protein [Phycisphaerales bacterium]